MKLSIVIPAYNEEARIRPTLEAYASYFEAQYGDDVEIVVVVNGSKDRTEQLVRAVAEKSPKVRCLVEPRAIGKGGRSGLGSPRRPANLWDLWMPIMPRGRKRLMT